MPSAIPTLDHLPPVAQLHLREQPTKAELGDYHKFFTRLFPELRRQAEWTISNLRQIYPEREADRTSLCISPSSGIDPFSRFGKCFDPKCRELNAARLLGQSAYMLMSRSSGTPSPIKRYFQSDGIAEFGKTGRRYDRSLPPCAFVFDRHVPIH